MDENSLFYIDYPNGRKRLPLSVLKTSDIFEFCLGRTKIDRNVFSLFFNSVYIDENNDFSLLDIGYCPSDKIELKNIESKTAYFTIPSFQNIITMTVCSNTTCYDVETHFSKMFLTVPQNIIIQSKGEKIPDDSYIYDYKNSEDFPFIISLRDGYQFFYYFFCSYFNFVCLKNNSTLRDLKDTIMSRRNLTKGFDYGDKITKYFRDLGQDIIENKELNQLLEIEVFDFRFDNPTNFEPIEVKAKLSTPSGDEELKYEFFDVPTVYYFACRLEEMYGIDRSLFEPKNQNGTAVNLSSNANNTNNQITFSITRQLKVSFDGKIYTFHYLSKIKNLRELLKFNNTKNVGVVINKKLITSANDDNYLVEFLNNQYKDEITKIELIKPLYPCSILTFNNPKNKINQKIIVPDLLVQKMDELLNFYFNSNINSFKFVQSQKDKLDHIYNYYIPSKADVVVKLFDDTNNTCDEEYVVKIKDYYDCTRIIDLFYIIQEKKGLKRKNPSFRAYFSGTEMYPLTKLRYITYNKTNKIEIHFNLNEENKSILISDLADENNRFDLTENLEVIDILKKCKLDKKEYSIFLNYMKLREPDRPFICSKDIKLHFAKHVDGKVLFYTNNSPLMRNYYLKEKMYYNASQPFLCLLYLNSYENVDFSFKLNKDSKEIHHLNRYFNASVIPENSIVIVDYKFEKPKKLTFRINSSEIRIIDISNIDLPINKLKSEIKSKLSLNGHSEKSLYFAIYNNVILDENKSFLDYNIHERFEITAKINPNTFIIKVKFPEIQSAPFHVTHEDTVQDIKNIIKKICNYNNDDFHIRIQKEKTNLNDDDKITENMKLEIVSKKRKIQLKGSLGDKTYELSELLAVYQAVFYIATKRKVPKHSFSIFIRNFERNCYDNVDRNTRLFEINSENLFAHNLFILDSIRFDSDSLKIDITQKSHVSELNTVDWFKRNIIAKKIMSNKEIVLKSGKILADFEIIGQSINTETTLEIAKKPLKLSGRKSFSFKPKYKPTELSNNDEKVEKEPKISDVKSKKNENNNDDDDEENSSSSIQDDDENNEEEKTNDDEPTYPYQFQIGSDDVFTLSFKESATVEDAKIKIASDQGDIDPSCVSILFAGKNLKKSINLKNLKLTDEDILYVYIRNIEEILLLTAKALKVYNQDDLNDYYSEFEEEEEEKK